MFSRLTVVFRASQALQALPVLLERQWHLELTVQYLLDLLDHLDKTERLVYL